MGSELEQMLAYKTRVAYVNPAYTSQRCARWGHVDAKSRKTQVVFCVQAVGIRIVQT